MPLLKLLKCMVYLLMLCQFDRSVVRGVLFMDLLMFLPILELIVRILFKTVFLIARVSI